MELNFRDLRADEIECRIGTAKEGKGVSLLLYKDARVDMTLLDETVGSMNWKREHSRENANCIVSIWDDQKKQWISKEDTGTESKTEAEKGLASDSFKRACVNWGIGRELYTSPFIWVSGASKYDKFYVKDITIENKKITALTICRKTEYGELTDDVAYQWPKGQKPAAKKSQTPKKEERKIENPKGRISATDAQVFKDILMAKGCDTAKLLGLVSRETGSNVRSIDDMTREQYVLANQLVQKYYPDKEESNE